MHKSLSLAWPCLGARTVLSVRRGPLLPGLNWVLLFQRWQLLNPGHPQQVLGQVGDAMCEGREGSVTEHLVLTHVDTPNLPSVGYVIPNFPMGDQRLRNVGLHSS